jgi:hypothetical protein
VRILAGCLLVGALTAVPPQTSPEFHARYGQPDAERFAVRPHLMLAVEYGADGSACKMRIEPRHGLIHPSWSNPPASTEEVMDVLNEVVPQVSRGKELGPGRLFGAWADAPPPTEYENMTVIQEFGTGKKPLTVSGVVVLFKRPACESLPKYTDPDWLKKP